MAVLAAEEQAAGVWSLCGTGSEAVHDHVASSLVALARLGWLLVVPAVVCALDTKVVLAWISSLVRQALLSLVRVLADSQVPSQDVALT